MPTYWDLKSLFNDLQAMKCAPLTPCEKTIICGLLSGSSPATIAFAIKWNSNSLKVALSREIYPLVVDLMLSKKKWEKKPKKKMTWNLVPLLLEDLGYKHPELKILDQNLLNLPFPEVSQADYQIKVAHVIKIIESAQKEQKSSKFSCLEKEQAFLEARKISEAKNYLDAISAYIKAIEMDPFNVFIIVNMVRCYDRMGAYYNSLSTCDLALQMLCEWEDEASKKEQTVKVYNHVSGAIHELARDTKDPSHIKMAYDLYHDALYNSPYDALIHYNLVELFVTAFKVDSFSDFERENYLDNAKNGMRKLQIVANNQESNFSHYKDAIINDLTSFCQGLDPWWEKQIDNLRSIGIDVRGI